MDEVNGIASLDELSDYEVSDEDPDVRGWDVSGREGRIGTVDQLLVDTSAMKVRYLDVELDDEFSAEERHVLIPVGYARLAESDNQVLLDNVTRAQIGALPAYTHGALTRDQEMRIRQAFDSGYTAEAAEEGGFYASDAYDEDRFYERGETRRMTLSEEELAVGKRDVEAGEVEIEKHVETRHASERVPVERDEVEIERRPASPGARAEIGEDEVHVPLSEEELVVGKREVPKEELVVRKKRVVDEETVDADLREERAEIHEEGDVERER